MKKSLLLKVFFAVYLSLIIHVDSSIAIDPAKPVNFYQHKVWDIEDGLPMNSVIAITQTRDGYLWVGTEAGLARFDGVNFDVFDHENTPALSKDLVLHLMVNRDGVLFISTRGGGLVRLKNGIFTALTTKDGLLSNEVWVTMESRDGSIWIGTKEGLNHLSEGKLSAVPLPRQLSTYNVRALAEDRFGRIWAGTRGSGLILIRRRSDGFKSEYKGPADLKVSALVENRSGILWVGTMENGLIRIQDNKQTHFNAGNGLSNNYVRCLYEDRAGNLWIGTYGGGINVIKSGGNRVSVFNKRGDLSSNSIYTFFEGREGILWIGTEGGGLNRLKNTKITTYTMSNGLSHDIVFGVFQDSRERIWVGTMGFGANYLQGSRFKAVTTKNNLSSDSVFTITEHPAGTMWFGTLGGGINRFKDGRVDVFTTKNGLSDNFIRALYVDRSGNLWTGTDNGGIHRFVNNTFSLYWKLKFRVNTLLQDSRGAIWAGTWGGGLCRLKNGEIEIFDKKRGLSDNIVMCIHEDKEGVFWIGTYGGGLNRLRDGKFTCISKEEGLPDDTIYCILEDRNHYLWMSSNRGIFRVDRKEIESFMKGDSPVNVTLFSKEDGMKSIECNGGNQPAGWQAHDGKIWFPTTKGVSVIDPDNLMVNTLPPPVQIKKIIIDGKTYTPGQNTEIPPGEGNAAFHYTALSFIVPERVLFKHKLEGLDKDWVEAGNSRTVTYRDIPPGSYRFRVIACNSDGIWNNSGASYAFRLRPKFYQTLLFKSGLPLLILFILFLFYYSTKKIISFRKVRKKYKSSSLSPEEAEQYLQKILYCIETGKVYRDENISLNSLSKKLKISPRLLSRVINERLQKSFYDLVNYYRVREAREMLRSPEMQCKSVLEIGYEVGFNSKSAYNRAFKKFTGLTPSQSRREYSSKIPEDPTPREWGAVS